MNWLNLIAQLGTFGIGAAALSYLTKLLIEHSLAKDLDKFNATLQAKHDIAIERLRADLRVDAFSQETKLAALHERRAAIIADLYSRLAVLHSAFTDLLHPVQFGGSEVQSAKRQSLVDHGNEFFKFFDKNRIYFDEPFCERVDSLNQVFRRAWIEFTVKDQDFPDPLKWLEVWERFENQVPALRREIEGSLRLLMGVSNEPEHRTEKAQENRSEDEKALSERA